MINPSFQGFAIFTVLCSDSLTIYYAINLSDICPFYNYLLLGVTLILLPIDLLLCHI